MPLGIVGSEKFNDFPWEDIGGHRQQAEMHELLEFYRQRAYFHPPYRGLWMSMSNEEIASIFHIPNSNTLKGSLARIGSKTAVAPINLPQ